MRSLLPRIVHARFGRLQLAELTAPLLGHAHHHYHAILKVAGPDCYFSVNDKGYPLTPGKVLLVNSWEKHAYTDHQRSQGSVVVFSLYFGSEWLTPLTGGFRRYGHPRLFCQPWVEVSNRIRAEVDYVVEMMLYADTIRDKELENLVREIALELLTSSTRSREVEWLVPAQEAVCDAQIKKAMAYIEEHVTSRFDSSNAAAAANMSRAQFYSRFKQCTTLTPHVFANLLRIEAAIAGLVQPEPPIEDLSEELGFSAPSNFARFFHQRTGITPSEYRRNVMVIGEEGIEPRRVECPTRDPERIWIAG